MLRCTVRRTPSRTACRAALLAAVPLLPLACAPVPAVIAPAPPALAPVAVSPANPLLAPWTTPHGVPPYDRIEDAHYRPAFDAALAAQAREIEALAARTDAPTFANTVEAMEAAGQDLRRVSAVFFALNSAHTNDTLQALARDLAPRLAAASDDLLLNERLFARVDAVYRQRDALGLSPEERRVLEETHKQFVRGGIALAPDAKARLRALNADLARLSQQYAQNLLAETNAYALFVTDPADLAGLPDDLVAAAAAEATRRGRAGQHAFTLAAPSLFPFLTYAPNRAQRQQLYAAYTTRGHQAGARDNRPLLAEMAALRAERARLLGADSHADFVLEETMAGTPGAVRAFLDRLWTPALARAKAEEADLTALLRADGHAGPLEGHDWWYYAEKLRAERYAFDDAAVRPYFELAATRTHMFELARRLWGVTFTARPDLPVYHEDVEAWEVKEADGRHVGIFYTDYHTRPSKRGGAWMTSARSQSQLLGHAPVVFNVCNFPARTPGQPTLLTFDEVTTLYHEFGHALHGLFSAVRYPSLAGTSVSRDFVEFPSQILENWPGEAAYLAETARHVETGAPIPADLLDKMKRAATAGEGFRTAEYLAASYLDLAWHTLPEGAPVADVEAFERAEMQRLGLPDAIAPRYRSGYFAHVFSGGYSAGYYSYIWAAVLDADGFEAFREQGLYDAALAQRLRETVLSRGNTRPAMDMYRDFRGREPDVAPLLRRRGLAPAL